MIKVYKIIMSGNEFGSTYTRAAFTEKGAIRKAYKEYKSSRNTTLGQFKSKICRIERIS